jgi:hypothetical protein
MLKLSSHVTHHLIWNTMTLNLINEAKIFT